MNPGRRVETHVSDRWFRRPVQTLQQKSIVLSSFLSDRIESSKIIKIEKSTNVFHG